MKRFALALLCWSAYCTIALSQPVTHPQNGVFDERQDWYAFTHATIITEPGKTIEDATLIIRQGKIEQVGKNVKIPAGCTEIDLKGKFIYPAFIELDSDYGMPELKPGGGHRHGPQFLSNKEGAYAWNQALKPEFNAVEVFKSDAKRAQELRKVGFGAALSHQHDGIMRGTGTAVLLGESAAHELILKERASAHFSFKKGSSSQDYPSSLMGAIALLRQTFYDGRWYKEQTEEVNLSLAAWNQALDLPLFFEVRDRFEALRADKIGDEFNVQYIMRGEGDEYQRIEELKATGAKFILPLTFPDAYDVEDPIYADIVSLADMMHWELAPYNPARLAAAGIPFAFTSDDLKKREDFLKLVRKTIKYGLSKDEALRALTLTPASYVGLSSQVGSIEKGKVANFLICSGDIFEDGSTIFQNWVSGKRFVLAEMDKPNLLGTYFLNVDSVRYTIYATGSAEKTVIKDGTDSTAVELKYSLSDKSITIVYNPDKNNPAKQFRLSGVVEDGRWFGTGQNQDGRWVTWDAKKVQTTKAEEAKEKSKKETPLETPASILYPFNGYGNTSLPSKGAFLIKNATVWTNETDGIMTETDVLVKNGKIEAIGHKLPAAGATIIDATGKHLTAGIIDEHSHIAISRGVNEGTQASSAEVRIGDVVNSDDVNIYRQLAGGVTTCHLLHGSANPIGGQSQLIKLRWGYAPEAMKFEGADGFIKFALGENVKQSNWGEDNTIRFPQTRMGVEQVFEDHFTRAREYGDNKGAKRRRDIELDALLQILKAERFITCHSYVQSEINMLMKVAQRHGFKVNTFTHILEGYKVADKMAEHGAGGSTFADWWAYKMEVKDAIPYNAALMTHMGVVVAINSDDAEMARRLNQEAAKAVKYGGLSEEAAWKTVTLNPAILLHVEDKVGSIKVGKHADLVLWSDNPLSMYAKAEKTFVDGILFFDLEQDKAKRSFIEQERARLIRKMIDVKSGGANTQKPQKKEQHHYHCDDVHDELHD